jgi:non-ribosomal peptide synthase protein (TIGR01720 family)
LETAVRQIVRDEPIALPAKTTSFKYWSEQLERYANSDAVVNDSEFWLTPERSEAAPIPLDFANGREENTEESLCLFNVRLSEEETAQLLHEVPKIYRTQINEVLLTALWRSVSRWTGRPSLLVEIESHGREEDLFDDVDLSRTVGWFTTYYPLLVRAESDSDLAAVLQLVKGQVRAVPQRGFHYSLLRYLAPSADVAATLARLPQADINFNYLGQFGQVVHGTSLYELASSDTSYGLDRSPIGLRSHLLEVVGWVVDDCLHVDWSYSGNAHHESTIARLAADFLSALRELIRGCETGSPRNVAAAEDFDWNDSDLADIQAAISKAQGTA